MTHKASYKHSVIVGGVVHFQVSSYKIIKEPETAGVNDKQKVI